MGKQLNFYRSAELFTELEAEALAQTKLRRGSPCTPQEMLREAWNLRPETLRLAARDAKPARKAGGR